MSGFTQASGLRPGFCPDSGSSLLCDGFWPDHEDQASERLFFVRKVSFMVP
ncbi:hypothetical protein PHLCEN_2v918 [Hermanssonia centrifuga]|uniref:Uncharacterized protein n=1 Tax=Hermanssonia centrifuga TaxID=98765 RepID=A0A2R6S4T5_9APHY|nr:hypothetical protein PHLCEN_2v918 [Hermanssonia centrifuga]